MREVVFGDIGVNSKIVSPDPCGDAVPSAGALVLTFLLNNYPDSDFQRLAKQWEKEVRGAYFFGGNANMEGRFSDRRILM